MNVPKREEGQGLVEYALLLVLVALAIIVILTLLGTTVVLTYAKVIGGLNGQSVTGTGTEYIILSIKTTANATGGACHVTITDAAVVVLQDGALITDGTYQLPYTTNGAGHTTSVSLAGETIAHTSFNFTGSAPLKLETPGGYKQTFCP